MNRRELLQGGAGCAAALLLGNVSKSVSAQVRNAGSNGDAMGYLPLGEIRPEGWLKRQLEIQADGMGGHLDEFWPDVGSNSGWLGGNGESWERGPYFVDGLYPLAVQLGDQRLRKKRCASSTGPWIINSPAG